MSALRQPSDEAPPPADRRDLQGHGVLLHGLSEDEGRKHVAFGLRGVDVRG